jgi:hypothetical protein
MKDLIALAIVLLAGYGIWTLVQPDEARAVREQGVRAAKAAWKAGEAPPAKAPADLTGGYVGFQIED